MERKALVCGAGGFIGHHLVKRLKEEGYWVVGADLKKPDYSPTSADEFLLGDLRSSEFVAAVFRTKFEVVYQLAADMGGAGYIFTGENDAQLMYNSALINLNLAEACRKSGVSKVFFSSSACIYPERNQLDPANPQCREDSAYPAAPDSEYGWEKLFGERMYLAFQRNYGIEVRIARFHNIFGEEGTWTGGREKAPAAICRKVAEAPPGSSIEIWGDGRQTRSFLYIHECIEGIQRLMRSEFTGPVNLGSEEMITVDELARLAMQIAGKKLMLDHKPGPTGVRGRTSDNALIREKLGWAPSQKLVVGLERTYRWIESEVTKSQASRFRKSA